MEDYVTYEQAKALKELGFDWKCNHYYDIETKEFIENHNDYSPEDSFSECSSYDDHNGCWNCVSAPTLSQAQKWLREVKKIYVFSHIIGNPPRDKCKYYWKVETNNSRTVDSSAITELSLTYEQALSEGIDKALEFLK